VREAFLAAMGFAEAEIQALRPPSDPTLVPTRKTPLGDRPVLAWIPITIGAALAQTLRNAAQRHLTGDLGALGATLVRFLYGLPFAAVWLVIVWLAVSPGKPLPGVTPPFLAWTVVASLSQIVATALLLRCMEERNFALGIAYAKTEVIQVALFGLVLLGDRVDLLAIVAILVATAGGHPGLASRRERSFATIAGGWTSRAALLGVGSGAAFGMAAVGYRGAALALDTPSIVLAAAYSLVWSRVSRPCCSAAICWCAASRWSSRYCGSGGYPWWPAAWGRSARRAGSPRWRWSRSRTSARLNDRALLQLSRLAADIPRTPQRRRAGRLCTSRAGLVGILLRR
jgi:hypothetical protein